MISQAALAQFLGVTTETVLDTDEVRGKVLTYIREKELKDGKVFNPDEKLLAVLGDPRYVVAGEVRGYSFLNVGRYLADQLVKINVAPATVESVSA